MQENEEKIELVDFLESMIKGNGDVAHHDIEMINYIYASEIPYDITRSIVIDCCAIVKEMILTINTGFDYSKLLKYLEKNEVDITGNDDYEKIEQLWYQKICSEKISECVADIYKICNIDNRLSEDLNRCFIRILICCYTAISAAVKGNPDYEGLFYTDLLMITVAEMWTSNVKREEESK